VGLWPSLKKSMLPALSIVFCNSPLTSKASRPSLCHSFRRFAAITVPFTVASRLPHSLLEALSFRLSPRDLHTTSITLQRLNFCYTIIYDKSSTSSKMKTQSMLLAAMASVPAALAHTVFTEFSINGMPQVRLAVFMKLAHSLMFDRAPESPCA
jgi:hypothetical protein